MSLPPGNHDRSRNVILTIVLWLSTELKKSAAPGMPGAALPTDPPISAYAALLRFSQYPTLNIFDARTWICCAVLAFDVIS